MTHFVGIVIAEDEEFLERMLAPYDEQLDEAPRREYMSEEDLTRMKDHYGITEVKEVLEKLEDWHGEGGGVDRKGIYRWATYNRNAQWDWYQVGGRWGDIIDNDVGTFAELMKAFKDPDIAGYTPSIIVDPVEGWRAEAKYGWFGMSTPTEEADEWEDTIAEMLETYGDDHAFVVDFHI